MQLMMVVWAPASSLVWCVYQAVKPSRVPRRYLMQKLWQDGRLHPLACQHHLLAVASCAAAALCVTVCCGSLILMIVSCMACMLVLF
jgi:hypothetical protein